MLDSEILRMFSGPLTTGSMLTHISRAPTNEVAWFAISDDSVYVERITTCIIDPGVFDYPI